MERHVITGALIFRLLRRSHAAGHDTANDQNEQCQRSSKKLEHRSERYTACDWVEDWVAAESCHALVENPN